MKNETRKHYGAYLAQLAAINGVASAAEKFTVAPSIQQKLESSMQESSAFLQLINVVGVEEQSGESLGLGISGTIAGRTDTSGAGTRTTQDPTGLTKDAYECKQTNFDTHIKYATLDAWAKFKDFQTRVSAQVVQRCALDRIMIGWNGTSAAVSTNRATSPLLQDVNIGWLQKLRANAAARVMTGGAAAGKVTVGAGGDYANLDALVYDAYKTLLDPWFQEDPQLVAIVGRDLMHDKLFPLVAENDAPTEKLAADIVISQRRLGGLPAMVAPFFPAGKVLITRADNLSIYYQDGKRRRAVVDKPERDRIEFFESSNDAYVIEDYGLCALVENIEDVAP
ncbi:phage major capsid protein, P2 family [Rhodococcus sp. SRB_17]|uniref:phage major capsid protein, P2 family n=1 Tax=Acidovorax sp. SRB_24 TaxID=1962700 RepID=UPI00145F8988|nr:phage major capsid protein, P2 family [Acidovorax sp. SRB_24]NMM75569.1 phage major capsid protein, P2 family [Acidovorax sp. SRB_24]NMM85090.1 phage major capsid protein, P2 family [Rhodococcus sp. SRB_17]